MFASFCAIFVEVAVVVGSKPKIVRYDVLPVEATASKSDMRKNTPVMRHSLASFSMHDVEKAWVRANNVFENGGSFSS